MPLLSWNFWIRNWLKAGFVSCFPRRKLNILLSPRKMWYTVMWERSTVRWPTSFRSIRWLPTFSATKSTTTYTLLTSTTISTTLYQSDNWCSIYSFKLRNSNTMLFPAWKLCKYLNFLKICSFLRGSAFLSIICITGI